MSRKLRLNQKNRLLIKKRVFNRTLAQEQNTKCLLSTSK